MGLYASVDQARASVDGGGGGWVGALGTFTCSAVFLYNAHFV
jgi:hypothetical protein